MSNTKSTNQNIPFPQPSSSSNTIQDQITNSPEDDFSPSRITDSRMSTRSRRAYYTPQTPRQFSRSAAKRDSVMALGSIAHLQHYFVKNGLASKDRPGQNKSLVLAIPGATSTLTEEEEEEFDELPTPLPPPPMPSQPYFPPGRALPNLTDLETARREVMNQLDQVCESWGLIELTSMKRVSSAQSNRSISDQERSSNTTSPALRPTEDDFVVNLLALTTGAVRSVQKFILTLPDLDLIESNSKPGSTQGGLERRISHLELSTSARPRISKSVLNPFRSTSSSSSTSNHNNPSNSGSSKPFSRASLVDPFALFKKRLPSQFNNNNQTNNYAEESKEDPLSVLRRTSLDVLGCLKEIEFRYRIPGSATPTEPFQSTVTTTTSSSPDFSSDTPPLIETTTEDSISSISGSTHLLPALSWDYRSDLGLQDVRQEALVVKRWLEAVDGVLEGVTIINRRPAFHLANSNFNLKHKSSQSSIGLGLPSIKPSSRKRNKFKKMFNSSKPNETGVPGISIQEEKEEEAVIEEEEEEDDDDENPLEKWAREEVEEKVEEKVTEEEKNHKKLIRAYECLRFFLPFDHLSHLKSPVQSRSDFLKSLSDGMLVCIAYNVALRQSHRPWGFIPNQSIHNIIELEQRNLTITSHSNHPNSDPNERIGLKFRRMDNLRVWAAALKLRYLIKSQSFEPKIVARSEDGWEKMLENLLFSWIEGLILEKREEIFGL